MIGFRRARALARGRRRLAREHVNEWHRRPPLAEGEIEAAADMSIGRLFIKANSNTRFRQHL